MLTNDWPSFFSAVEVVPQGSVFNCRFHDVLWSDLGLTPVGWWLNLGLLEISIEWLVQDIRDEWTCPGLTVRCGRRGLEALGMRGAVGHLRNSQGVCRLTRSVRLEFIQSFLFSNELFLFP